MLMHPLQIAAAKGCAAPFPLGCQRPWSRESCFSRLASHLGAPGGLQRPNGLMTTAFS